jgi:type VI secretion system Hcp family effector
MKKVISFIGALVSIIVISPAFAQVAQFPFNYFLFIDGIPGDSRYLQDRVTPWIDILSFKEGITQPSAGTRNAAGGASALRPQLADLTVTKRLDRASVILKRTCASGTAIKGRVVLVCALKNPMQQEIYRVTLDNTFVSAVKFSADGAGVLEEVSFSYGVIEWIYTPIDQSGKAMGGIKSRFDLIGNIVK